MVNFRLVNILWFYEAYRGKFDLFSRLSVYNETTGMGPIGDETTGIGK
eukprot:gene15535-4670_t